MARPAIHLTKNAPALHIRATPVAREAYSVSFIVGLAQKRLRERITAPFWVRGEVSGWKRSRGGHCYFTMKDRTAEVSCILLAHCAERLPALPEDGMQVDVYGTVGIYVPRGQFRLEVERIEATGGDGLWQLALDQLRNRLRGEGLLDDARKRPLPPFAERVGVVTSQEGSVLFDMHTTMRRRAWWIPMLVSPCSVEGMKAAPEIAAAIRRFGSEARGCPVDVVIVARGGGSRESLWAFNSEPVARALAACPVPTISAVGHETDFTLADEVADVRAATPTAAAQRAVPDGRALQEGLEAQREEIRSRMLRHCRLLATRIEGVDRHVRARSPAASHRRAEATLQRTVEEMERALGRRMAALAAQVETVEGHLALRSPAAGLARAEERLRQLAAEVHASAASRQREVARELEELGRALDRAVVHRLHGAERDLAMQAEALDARSPLRVLARGYAVAEEARTGSVIRNPAQAPEGTPLRIRLAEGDLLATSHGPAPADS
jgi:exodeoxyribonuclease VII large subunit